MRDGRTRVRDLYRENHIGKTVTVSGWARTVRAGKNVGFIELNDGSFFKGVQIVFSETLENFAEAARLTVGAETKQG